MLRTAFWTRAANSLPSAVRERYLGHFEQAERWELALDAAVELFQRAKNVRYHAPKSA